MSTPIATENTASTLALVRLVREHELLAFFVLAFGLTWLAVLPLLVAPPGTLPQEIFLIGGALLGPTLSAYIVTTVKGGRAAALDLLRRYVQWRVGLQWYLFILIAPVAALTLTGTIFIGLSLWNAFLRDLSLLATFYLPVTVVGILLGPLWEEPGWRGFALPRLQKLYGPLAGTLILGVLWSLWHLPGYVGGWLGPFSLMSFAALLIGTTGFAFVMTWVYNNTQGSLLIMILLHSAANAAVAMGGRLIPRTLPPSAQGLVEGGWIPAITYAVAAVLLLVITRGWLSYNPK